MNSVREAIPYYRKAVNRAPGHSKYAYHLGTALLETQSPEQAIPYLKKAANGRIHFAKAWLRLGEAQENVGVFKSAVQSYMRAIRANPTLSMTADDSGIAYHKLGRLYVRFGLYDKALEVYANGLELNPDSLMLLHGRGVAEMKMKDYDTAIETFRRVVKKDSTRISANFNLASALRQKGEFESAVKQLESFMSRADPADHEARIRVARDLIDKWNKKAEN
jgi:tetratricopeptide (TPR) repeat protein